MVTRPTLLPISSVNQSAPSGPAVIPYGTPFDVGIGNSLKLPEVVTRPTFVCALALASSAQAAFPGANGKIAFTYGNGNVDTINPDGTGQTTLAQYGYDPAWSADGCKLVYITGEHLATVNAGGSGQTDLGVGDSIPFYDFRSPYTFIEDPTWSPDGTQIAFGEEYCYPDDGCANYYVWIVNADGSGRHHVAAGGTDPSWSPDGQWIA